MKKIIIPYIILFAIILSSKAQAQTNNPFKIQRNNGFLEFGLSGEAGFLKNEYGDFKYGDGGGMSFRWFFCWGNHCLGFVFEGGSVTKRGSGTEYRPGDVSVFHFGVPPFGYRYLIKPFFIEAVPHLVFIDRYQSGTTDAEYTLAVRGGITKEFEWFRVGVSAGLIVSSEFVIGSLSLFTGIVF